LPNVIIAGFKSTGAMKREKKENHVYDKICHKHEPILQNSYLPQYGGWGGVAGKTI